MMPTKINNIEPKRGRPHGPTYNAKAGIVKVRVDLSEKGKWVAKARKEGLKLSEWIRRIANEAK